MPGSTEICKIIIIWICTNQIVCWLIDKEHSIGFWYTGDSDSDRQINLIIVFINFDFMFISISFSVFEILNRTRTTSIFLHLASTFCPSFNLWKMEVIQVDNNIFDFPVGMVMFCFVFYMLFLIITFFCPLKDGLFYRILIVFFNEIL